VVIFWLSVNIRRREAALIQNVFTTAKALARAA